jgi:hypothetical protein
VRPSRSSSTGRAPSRRRRRPRRWPRPPPRSGPALPRVESHQDSTPVAHTPSTNARPQTAQHGVHRDVPEPPALARAGRVRR